MNTSGYVILEGNIGVGKSTFCRHLADAIRAEGGKEQRAEYVPEPDEKTNPFLDDYYRDPAGHAFEMQCHMLHRRFAATQYAVAGARNGKGWYILDRSYYGDVCFARVQLAMGYFTEGQFKSYLDAHKSLRSFLEPPSAAIFLRAKPETCNRRIARRARDCEAGIDPGYLEAIQEQIDRLETSLRHRTRVIALEWDDDRSDDDLRAEARAVALRLLHMHTDEFDF